MSPIQSQMPYIYLGESPFQGPQNSSLLILPAFIDHSELYINFSGFPDHDSLRRSCCNTKEVFLWVIRGLRKIYVSCADKIQLTTHGKRNDPAFVTVFYYYTNQ